MRRIPTAKQKEELKQLLKKQYEDAIESIDRDEDLRPAEGDWHLSDEIEKTRKRIYEEVHIGKRSCGSIRRDMLRQSLSIFFGENIDSMALTWGWHTLFRLYLASQQTI